MPKIWQNLKNINDWLSDSPTWIQEMLAHLKIVLSPELFPFFLDFLVHSIVDNRGAYCPRGCVAVLYGEKKT